MAGYTIAEIYSDRRKNDLDGNEFFEIEDLISGTLGTRIKDVANWMTKDYIHVDGVSGVVDGGVSVLHNVDNGDGKFDVKLREIIGSSTVGVELSGDQIQLTTDYDMENLSVTGTVWLQENLSVTGTVGLYAGRDGNTFQLKNITSDDTIELVPTSGAIEIKTTLSHENTTTGDIALMELDTPNLVKMKTIGGTDTITPVVSGGVVRFNSNINMKNIADDTLSGAIEVYAGRDANTFDLRTISPSYGTTMKLSEDGKTIIIGTELDIDIIKDSGLTYTMNNSLFFHEKRQTIINMSDGILYIDAGDAKIMGGVGAVISSNTKYDSIELVGVHDPNDDKIDWVILNGGAWTLTQP